MFKDMRRKNPRTFTAVERSLRVAGGLSALPILGIAVLDAIGFSSVGPVAGSVAAGIQSGIGAVKAGSAFALAQSITMTPAILAAASGGAVFGTGALAASGVIEFAYDDKGPPSVTWDDGEIFQPKVELLDRLADFLGPKRKPE